MSFLFGWLIASLSSCFPFVRDRCCSVGSCAVSDCTSHTGSATTQVGNHVIEAAKAKLDLLPFDVKQLANQLGGLAKGMANGIKVLGMVWTRYLKRAVEKTRKSLAKKSYPELRTRGAHGFALCTSQEETTMPSFISCRDCMHQKQTPGPSGPPEQESIQDARRRRKTFRDCERVKLNNVATFTDATYGC